MYQYHTLSNGIRIVFRRNSSPVIHSGVYINVGSRDENCDQEGMAHFIEHSLFKGTERRSSRSILSRIDGVGGELNAFTTKEETCLYASSLTIHLERCIELFADILFHSTFPEKEIEKEKDVVIEEINSYRDAPADLIYDEFEERFFAGHTLAHNILGSKRGVRSFSSESLRHFMRTHYTTDRMVISVVGDVDFGRVVRLCEKHFQSSGSVERGVERAVLPVPVTPFSISLNRRTHQMHVLIGYEAPHTYDDRKVAFTLLNNILGGPAMNSRLNVAIRERYGFCYTIESQYTPLSDTGLFYIYAGIDPLSYDKFMELVEIQLRGVAERELSPSMLRAAQQQLIGQMAISGESAQGEMQSMGKALMTYGRVETLEEMRDDVLSISAGELRSVAERYFFSGRKGTLIYS